MACDSIALKFFDDFKGYNFLISRIVDKATDTSEQKKEIIVEMSQ